MVLTLDDEVRYIKGVGPVRAGKFSSLGIRTVYDLLLHIPRRYIERSRRTDISGLKLNEKQTVVGRIVSVRVIPTRKRLHILSAVIDDGTGRVEAVWFNQPYLIDRLKEGELVSVTGRVRFYKRLQVVVEDFAPAGGADDWSGLRGLYSLTEGLGQRFMRRVVKQALVDVRPRFREHLPERILKKRMLPSLVDALWMVHFPEDEGELRLGLKRLKFDELLLMQLVVTSRRKYVRGRDGVRLEVDGAIERRIRARIPFKLTAAQERVMREVRADMAAPFPMYRLLQGDVGCGKTVVALFAMLVAVANKMQAVMMAPTELLAEQHYLNLRRLLQGSRVRIGCLTSSVEGRRELLRRIREGEVDIVVGTHAVFGEEVEFKGLALVVIDEQQKFGVAQRARLLAKAQVPNLLVMTATPIPRSLALTIFGDTDVSVIDEMPPGRVTPETRYLPPERFRDAVEFVKGRLKRGEQAFVVCPSIEDIDEGTRGVETAFAEWRKALKGCADVEMLHGRMPAEERERLMARFRARRFGLLVATTVIEVGLDIAGATVMVVENAQRFGLAQLHQLRGRIGRGGKPSWCILTGSLQTEEAKKRIRALLENSDGFRIAEEDLRIRGPGEFLGERQSGLPDIRIADLIEDYSILMEAREDAQELLKDGGMSKAERAVLREWVVKRLGERWRIVVP